MCKLDIKIEGILHQKPAVGMYCNSMSRTLTLRSTPLERGIKWTDKANRIKIHAFVDGLGHGDALVVDTIVCVVTSHDAPEHRQGLYDKLAVVLACWLDSPRIEEFLWILPAPLEPLN